MIALRVYIILRVIEYLKHRKVFNFLSVVYIYLSRQPFVGFESKWIVHFLLIIYTKRVLPSDAVEMIDHFFGWRCNK